MRDASASAPISAGGIFPGGARFKESVMRISGTGLVADETDVIVLPRLASANEARIMQSKHSVRPSAGRW
jgi:hypothetical protein